MGVTNVLDNLIVFGYQTTRSVNSLWLLAWTVSHIIYRLPELTQTQYDSYIINISIVTNSH